MALTMAASRRSSNGSAVAVVFLAFVGWHAVFVAFVGGSPKTTASRVPARVNIFGDFNLPSIGGQDVDKEELGTRSARVADEANSRVVECALPLGLKFEEKDGGDIYIKAVDESSDAYFQGIRPGAQVVMVSNTFGDEMLSTKNVRMTQFLQVLQSRFGNTVRLALEKENKQAASNFWEQFAPKKPQTEAEKKQEAQRNANMAATFEEEEAKLADKNFWNPFR